MIFALMTFVLAILKVLLIVILASLVLYHGVNIVTYVITAIRFAGRPKRGRDFANYLLASCMLVANSLFMALYSGAIFSLGRSL